MRKKCVMKRVLAGIMVFAAVALAGKSSALVSTNATVAEAAGRVVTINSCVIQGGDVVVNVSAATLPSSDDGKYYLVADEVYQDGTVGNVVASTDRAANATLTFPLNHYQPGSNLSKNVPSRAMRNFAKFHLTFLTLLEGFCDVR